MPNILVVVLCGKAKIWDNEPARGPVPAHDAYTGSPFVVNREYAERFGAQWRILRAKDRLVPPEADIGPYNVSFKEPTTRPIAVEEVREQVRAQGLHEVDLVIGLRGKEYRAVVQAAFAPWPVPIRFPFAGLPLGHSMRAAKVVITSDNPEPTLAGLGLSPASSVPPASATSPRGGRT